MKRVPLRLQRDPIVEAIFEIRFEPSRAPVSEILPGMLFAAFGEQFPSVDRLPLAQLPRELQQQDPDLKYQARTRLAGKQFALMVGDNVVAVNCLIPYVGWSSFKPLILAVLSFISRSQLIGTVERYSLKYVNVLEAEITDLKSQFAYLDFGGTLGSQQLEQQMLFLRTEFQRERFASVIELAAGARVVPLNGKPITGLVLSIDTVCRSQAAELLVAQDKLVEEIRQEEKRIFFDLISESAANTFGAIWSTT